MNAQKADFENWHVEYVPEDGARITVLRYKGNDLLTSIPAEFRPPDRFYGEYETRPVFGYDDCFPTVDACTYPGGKFDCRDHGELCWQRWEAEVLGNKIVFSAYCLKPAVNFRRILTFEGNKLNWRFEVTGLSDEKSVFLHIMHALLPLNQITGIEIPGCGNIFDEIKSEETDLKSSENAMEHLFSIKPGSFTMLLLRDLADGYIKLSFTSGILLNISFDHNLFPTLGIWWNNAGYPEGSQVRTECAFEPIPGTCSDLSKSFEDGVYLLAESGKPVCWEITWTVS